jgi:sulfide dehydrogenase cytochrome subunit
LNWTFVRERWEIDAMKLEQQRLCVGAALAFAVLGAHAQDTLQVKSLAATCASCHGTNGKAVDGAVVPGLAGVPAVHMVEQMKAFRAGSRQATVMHQIVKGYTDAQIEQLAAYFAAQPK